MTSEEHQWEINLVQNRYQHFKVSSEQAEKIYQCEKIKDTYSDKHHFSAWEEWDFETTTFKEILNEEQFREYEIFTNNNKEQYVQNLFEQDADKLKDISAIHERLDFYENQFLKPILSDPYNLVPGWLSGDMPKAVYLKAEYRRFLNDSLKEMLTDHFRHNRTFMPNGLKASIMRHKLTCIVPAYNFFRHRMDEPTKAVVHFLKTRLSSIQEITENMYITKVKELKEFDKINFQKYYGNDFSGWHSEPLKLTPEDEKEHMIMTLLLLDSNMYGY